MPNTSTRQRPANPKPNYRIMRKITRLDRTLLRVKQEAVAKARKEKGGAL